MVKRAQLNDKGEVVFVDVEEKPRPTTRAEAREQNMPRRSIGQFFYDTAKENLGRDAATLQKLRRGFTLGVADPIASGIIGGVESVRKGTDFGTEYRSARVRNARRQQAVNEQAGTRGEVAEFVGGMATPLGTGQKALNAINAVRRGAGAAKDLGRAGQYVVRGAQQGAVSGGLSSLTNSLDGTNTALEIGQNVARDTGMGAIAGAGLGLAMPIAATGARQVARLLPGGRFRGARQAVEEAQDNVIGLAERAGTVEGAERRIQQMTDQGVGPIGADMSRAAQDRLRALSDVGVRGTDEAAQGLDTRKLRRGERLRGAVESIAGLSSSTTRGAAQQARKDVRSVMGKQQYAVGGVVDQPVVLTPAQNKALMARTMPGNPRDKTFRQFYDEALETYNANPDNIPHKRWNIAPTMRVMDEVLRTYRQKITQLYRAGEGNQATALSRQFESLRGELRKQNPAYADILDFHAKEFAVERASDEMAKVSGGIFTKAREVMDVVRRAKTPEELSAMRQALTDRIFTDSGKRTVFNQMRQALATGDTPEREVIDFIMGGSDNTAKLSKWLDAEHVGVKTEEALGNSQSSRFLAAQQALEADAESAAANLARLGAGIASGSPGMATNASALSYKYGKRYSDQARALQVAPAEMSLLRRDIKPGDLTRMQRRVLERQAKRAARRTKPATAAGRAAGQSVADFTAPGVSYMDEEQ